MGVTDRLSKSVILIPMRTITAESVATALLRHVFSHHGLPRAIVSDRGPQFTSLFWALVCRQLAVMRRLSTAWHPETDGAQERSNQEIETYLRIFTSYLQDDWVSLLPVAQMALNNRTVSSIGLSPFFCTHGYHLELLEAPAKPESLGSTRSPATQAQLWLDKRRDATGFAQASLALAQETQERHANRGRQVAESFQVGDRVLLRLKNIRTNRPSKKLDWVAFPYRVTALVGSHAVRLNTPPGVHPVFHVSLIKRLQNNPLPSQSIQDTDPPAIETTDNRGDFVAGEYQVDKILSHRRRGRGFQVLVSWTGCPEPTWEPLTHLADTMALEAYEVDHQPPWSSSPTEG